MAQTYYVDLVLWADVCDIQSVCVSHFDLYYGLDCPYCLMHCARGNAEPALDYAVA